MSVKNVQIEVMEIEEDGQEAGVIDWLGTEKLSAFEMITTD